MLDTLRPAHVVAAGTTVLAGNVWLLGLADGAPDGLGLLYAAPALMSCAAVALRRLARRMPGAAAA